MNHCVLAVADADSDNTNVNPSNINFVIKETKLYVLAATLSAKDNQKLFKILSKKFKDQFISITNQYRYLPKSTFTGVKIDCWFLFI